MNSRKPIVATLARAWSAVWRRQLLLTVAALSASISFTIAQDGSADPAVTNSLGQRLQFIAAGSYIRGGRSLGQGGFLKDNVEYSGEDERPLHPVRLTKPFYLATTEVTVAQFRQFVEATGHKTSAEQSGTGIVGFDPHEPEEDRRAKFGFRQKPEFTWKAPGFPQAEDHPVTGVSWNDTQAFCRWLSEKEGVTYRLPTEAEWEYSCRAGTDTYFSWGDSYKNIYQLANIGNVELEKAHPDRVLIQWLVYVDRDPGDPHVYTAPVGSYPANPWGIQDLHGNVWEWCQDQYIDTAYSGYKQPRYGVPIPRAIDPLNEDSFNDDGDWRVIRGGSWFTSPTSCRSAMRSYFEANDAAAYLGFRVVRDASVEEVARAKSAFNAEEQARSAVEQAAGKFESQRGTDLRVRFNSVPARDVSRQMWLIGELSEIHVNAQAKMTRELLEDIAAVSSLKILHLNHSGDELTDEALAPLANSTGLEELRISSYPAITDDCLQYIGRLSNLTVLHLQGDKITDDGFRQLSGLTKLRELNVQATQSSGTFLKSLENAPLEQLTVSRLTDEAAQALTHFPNLTRLNVHDSPMTEHGFEAIAGLRRLKSLRLRNCSNIPPAALTGLANMHSLTDLDLIDTPVGDDTLELITNLELNNLSLNSGNVTDVGMRHICSMLTLRNLELGKKSRISDRGLKHFWRLNRLNQLSMHSPLISGAGFSTLAELPKLYTLRLTSPALTDKAFEYLSESPLLNHLEIGWSDQENSPALTDSGLQLLGHKANFRHISINTRGTQITSAGLDQLRTTLKNTRLDVRE
ncbi:MAG: SUMF1/EgtB/PvdO family nonheme iron enzyme [Planctomycetales bacterium]